MALVAALAEFVVALIGGLGYAGLFAAMALESTLVPLPSTVIMGFAGFLAWRGDFTLPGVVLAALAGSLAGSLLSYAMGRFGGRPAVERWGRWFLVGPRELAWTDAFFARHGAKAVFVARFLPAVRHVISIPAGAARMPMRTFLPATALGAFLWNSFLAYAGYTLGPSWESLVRAASAYDLAFLAVLGALFVLLVWHKVRRAREPLPAGEGAPAPPAAPGRKPRFRRGS